MGKIKLVITGLFFICCKLVFAQTQFTDDNKIYKEFISQLMELEKSQHVDYKTLQADLKEGNFNLDISKARNKRKLSGEEVAKHLDQSVYVIGKLFKHDKSGKMYAYQATCFPITEDGIMITNHHVFEDNKFDYRAIGVTDCKGNFYPVIKVLAASDCDDLAVFKIDTKGDKLKPLHLGQNGDLGSEVHILSNPKGTYKHYSKGYITRAYLAKSENNSQRMSVSAEFAVGSSGGPVVNSYGNVVGVVSTTFPYKIGKSLQMIVKEISPVSNIYKLIKNNQNN